MKKKLILLAFSFIGYVTLFGQVQYKSKYPDIPIVDIHTHIGNVNSATNFVKVSEAIKQKHGSNLCFWVGLSDPGESVVEQIKAATNNRILFSASQMSPHKGLTLTPEQVMEKVKNGYLGLKFFFGPAYRILKEGEAGITKIDDPRYDRFFSVLERANVLMTSLHIADPNQIFGNRGLWLQDPVYYWEQIRAFENFVAKHPNLTIVAAHGAWLVVQDAQIDFLRYMFSTYPNLYVDISATCHYMSLVNTDNLRDLYIEYQDRLLFGTDCGRCNDDQVDFFTRKYTNFFAILETDMQLDEGFFGNVGGKPIQGLNLPREVLEKIYYKNALKLYPGLKEAMGL